MKQFVIGTRGSALAMWQANHVRERLIEAHKHLQIRLEIIRTKGDRMQQAQLHDLLDKGLFTKEIQSALLAGSIDLAVHSLKDLPTEPVDGLTLAAVMPREDPADIVVAKNGLTLDTIPAGSEVLTGSLRRRAQVLHRRADLKVSSVRGNVETRLRKLDESDAQAIVLAGAGLIRLGLADRITERLNPTEFIPACGQGAIAAEIRQDDVALAELLQPLDDPHSRAATTAERAFLAAIQGGCQIPAGAYATLSDQGDTLSITGMLAEIDGARLLKRSVSGPLTSPDTPESLGRELAEGILAGGGREILDAIRRPTGESQESSP